ncbi:hypothetical protein K9L67_04050 [Candidatus Woesearchaeota archaeon]|nr:hypothetical protein [Candidatus Woesearchaeota archaeon]MCF7901374.1 hypothetical protein [Candidatus Woesearchaeota archaeon]MCF8013155.1 hypothetical protein [Candidatus Woesearchaeota archaeon]
MNEYSDLDFVMVVKENKDIKKVVEFNKIYSDKYRVKINISSFSLWELENNLRFKQGTLKAKPDIFLYHVEKCVLLLGEPLNSNKYPKRTFNRLLYARIKTFPDVFFPNYKENKLGFSDIAKQVFWLAELDLLNQGKEMPSSWKEIITYFSKDHVVNLAYSSRIRKFSENDKKIFFDKLDQYLDDLKKYILLHDF